MDIGKCLESPYSEEQRQFEVHIIPVANLLADAYLCLGVPLAYDSGEAAVGVLRVV